MAAVNVGINGFGRIGRMVFRVMAGRPDEFNVVGINDLADAKSLAHLLKYDTTQGRFNGTVEAKENALVVNGKEIPVSAEKDPAKLPWKEVKAKIVLEATGVFRKQDQIKLHLDAGAERVVLSAPPKEVSDPDTFAIIVLGVNEQVLESRHVIVSNASCTTNCLAPMAKVLNENFGLKRGLMCTIHSYTNDQRILDLIHSDLRRSRTAAQNIIPTTTGAAKAVGKVLPELDGKLDGYALRVPTPTGSFVDLACELDKDATAEQINQAMNKAADGELAGILRYETDPIVSSDIIGDPASCIFDSLTTAVMDGNFAKVCGWYDNEWGYSARTADVMLKVAAL
jgi:glyceraldehyde 3-phosphate dehydrogenase